MRSARITALAIALLCVALSAPARGQAARIDDFRSIQLSLPERAKQFSLDVAAFDRRFRLRLTEHEDLLAALPTEQRRRIPATDRFFRGDIEGRPGSWVRLHEVDGRISGGFFDGEQLWLIDRPGRLGLPAGRRAPAGDVLLYRYSDLVFDAPIDHGGLDIGSTAAPDGEFTAFGRHLREIVALEGAAALALPVTIVSDTQFTDRHGGATASVVAGRINFIDGIYADQVGVGLQLLHHEILSDNDVLTADDARELLLGRFDDDNNLLQPGFRQFMRSGSGSDIPFEGVAHLFTGRDLDGGTVGIAFLGVLCSSSAGYGVNQDLANDTTSALVFAHELGHNFGAHHDNDTDHCPEGTLRGIMNSSINGSEEFSDCSLDAMESEVAGASCLVESDALEAIFANGFEP